jgi:hypothetical protein
MGDQLNLYIPESMREIVERARRYAQAEGVPLYSVVLTALAEFLERNGEEPRFRSFRLGVAGADREGLYDEHLEHKLGEG